MDHIYLNSSYVFLESSPTLSLHFETRRTQKDCVKSKSTLWILVNLSVLQPLMRLEIESWLEHSF